MDNMYSTLYCLGASYFDAVQISSIAVSIPNVNCIPTALFLLSPVNSSLMLQFVGHQDVWKLPCL